MLSKTQSKYIRSLTQQKFRDGHKVFIAEGEKIAGEWLQSNAKIQKVIATTEWMAQHGQLAQQHPEAEQLTVTESELAAVSGLKSPNGVMLVVHLPEQESIPAGQGWYMALDGLQDPGNMGTIIRIADWFGIRHVVCSPACANAYSPKVVQSAMGSHLRVRVYERELVPFFETVGVPVVAASLGGDSVYNMPRMEAGVLVIGNESKGISARVMAMATHRVMIPRNGGAESLNAAVSAGILCALLLPC